MSNYRQSQENQEVEQQVAEVIDKALREPINQDEAALLRWATGTGERNAEHQ